MSVHFQLLYTYVFQAQLYHLKVLEKSTKNLIGHSRLAFNNEEYIEFIEINKHKKKLQIYIQQLMAAHVIVDNGYLKIE